jgi:phospholipase C
MSLSGVISNELERDGDLSTAEQLMNQQWSCHAAVRRSRELSSSQGDLAMNLPFLKKIATLVGSATLVFASGLTVSYADQSDVSPGAAFNVDTGTHVHELQPPAIPGGATGVWHPTSPDFSGRTLTPIKHVILIVGENRSFDHLFATYQPPKGQTISNLLSKGIVKADGTPGLNVKLAHQWQATDTDVYSIHPTKTQLYTTLPPPNVGSAWTVAPFSCCTPQESAQYEPALPDADDYAAYAELASGGTGIPNDAVDTRFPANLPNAPISMHGSVTDDDYTGDLTHRFYQMWQQLDCDANASTWENPSGCRSDLFPWVEVSVGGGWNGYGQPAGFNDERTYEGAQSMEFYNMAQGDVSYFAQLARQYSLSDNYHQAVQGGTGANHIMIGYGSLIYYADSNGNPATPPANQIENPNPNGANDWYTEDGYGGGSYTNCADDTQPGVAPIKAYLRALPYRVFNDGDCAPNAYYLVNNYNPGYLGDGTPAPLGATQFTVPPTTQNNLGLLLTKHNVSWKYYGEGWDGGAEDGELGSMCGICNPFLYSTQVMTNPTLRLNLQDITNLYSDIQNDTLPAVSIVKPDAILDGHPGSSKIDLFEGFTQKIIEMVQANPATWADTAILITFDEGGGYWDSGYVQPVDFFGDGTRIPLLVVSKYSQGGHVVHTYYDHVSFDKFVEANWGLHETISPLGRDNLPNPVMSPFNPYIPLNQPAIGNLMEMFNFDATDSH